jgi:hypothetical protein
MGYAFTDLHSFKDYVVFVQLCSPDEFADNGAGPDGQGWTLQNAFEGLRVGLEIAVEEKGPLPIFAEARQEVEAAFAAYVAGDVREGYQRLEKVKRMLRKVPSW